MLGPSPDVCMGRFWCDRGSFCGAGTKKKAFWGACVHLFPNLSNDPHFGYRLQGTKVIVSPPDFLDPPLNGDGVWLDAQVATLPRACSERRVN